MARTDGEEAPLNGVFGAVERLRKASHKRSYGKRMIKESCRLKVGA